MAVGGSCTIDAPASGQTKYYACQVGLHCQRGQVVAITGAAAPGTDHSFSDSVPGTDDDRQGCEPFCGDKSDAPPTPKPTTTLAKGGKADKDEDESDGSAALSLSLATAVAALFAV